MKWLLWMNKQSNRSISIQKRWTTISTKPLPMLSVIEIFKSSYNSYLWLGIIIHWSGVMIPFPTGTTCTTISWHAVMHITHNTNNFLCTCHVHDMITILMDHGKFPCSWRKFMIMGFILLVPIYDYHSYDLKNLMEVILHRCEESELFRVLWEFSKRDIIFVQIFHWG